MTESLQRRPSRVLDGLDDGHRKFWEYCNQRQLAFQRCDECGSHIWPPAPICDGCLSDNLTWTIVSGRGTIITYCIFERAYYAECPPPWPVILVELEEGPWFVSNPKNIPLEEIRAGVSVAATFIDCTDEHGRFALPVFEKRE